MSFFYLFCIELEYSTINSSTAMNQQGNFRMLNWNTGNRSPDEYG